MATIAELLQTIKDTTADLEKMVAELNQPFAGMIDTEAVEQVENDRNVDHANDNRI